MTRPDTQSTLTVTGVTKAFGAHLALEALDVSLPPGGVTGLIGPNGSGKTTLFNTITGIHAPSSGTVTFAGRNITGWASEKVAQIGIARTFQNLKVFKRLTVFDNVLGAQSSGHGLPLWQMFFSSAQTEGARRERVEQILEQVGLSDRRNVMAQELPLGEQRRLELARAMARDPELLLLDEPAGGMTPQETERMAELIRTISDNGPTVFLIEHKMGMVMKLCSHIVVLNFGRKIAEGTPKQVQENADVREAYLGSRAARA